MKIEPNGACWSLCLQELFTFGSWKPVSSNALTMYRYTEGQHRLNGVSLSLESSC